VTTPDDRERDHARAPDGDRERPRVTLVQAAEAAAAAASGEPVAIAVVVAPDPIAGLRLLHWQDGRVRGTLGSPALDEAALRLTADALAGAPPATHTVAVSAGPCVLYVEAHHPPEGLLVVGAGHIAVPLARLGVQLGFRVTVLDDREEFATAERFGENIDVRRADFEGDPFEGVRIDGRTYVALVTRGHAWDFDCLRLLLDRGHEPRYIGMIGSRRRVRAALGALLRAGYARERLQHIAAPIGLDIVAETPAEIAVSIAAELIAVRRGGSGVRRSQLERVLDRLLRDEARPEEANGGS
jgi:xanthine dehydrogenase accessory factor